MPALQISALPTPSADVDAILATLCRELAGKLGDIRHEQPQDKQPPLALVIAFEGRPAEVISRLLGRVATVLARQLGLDAGNVLVLYEEARPGRLHTGGQLAE